MVYIQFIYKLPNDIVSLANKEFVDFTDDRIYGWLKHGNANRLRHCSMYIVCRMETHGDLTVLREPTGIVAMNENEALAMYHAITGFTDGCVHSEIVSNCQNIKVEPTGEMVYREQ